MQLHYQNTREDFAAYYTWLWADRKAARRSEFYQSILWYLAVLGLAIYIAAKHEEVFASCVFGVLACFTVFQNWSFDRRWLGQIRESTNALHETANTLFLDDTGVIERFSGVEVRVAWSEIKEYDSQDDRLFICYFKLRAFVVPLRNLSASQRDELIGILEKHGVHKR